MSADRARRIEARLRERLGAVRVEVVDESHLHAGHAGARSGGGHFRATVTSPRFAGLSRIEAQRLVYQALDEMMGSEIHALSLRCESENEDSPPLSPFLGPQWSSVPSFRRSSRASRSA